MVQNETRNEYGKFKILSCLDFRRSHKAAEKNAVLIFTPFREKPHKAMKEASRNFDGFILYFN